MIFLPMRLFGNLDYTGNIYHHAFLMDKGNQINPITIRGPRTHFVAPYVPWYQSLSVSLHTPELWLLSCPVNYDQSTNIPNSFLRSLSYRRRHWVQWYPVCTETNCVSLPLSLPCYSYVTIPPTSHYPHRNVLILWSKIRGSSWRNCCLIYLLAFL